MPVGNVDFEPYRDSHPFMRALHMHKASMGLSDRSWTTVQTDNGSLHRVPKSICVDLRRRMRANFFQDRRYTTFNRTSVSITVTPELQQALNERWLEKLKDTTRPRPLIEVTVSLSMLTFGQGAPEMRLIKTAV